VWNVCAADKNSSSAVSSSAEYVVKVVSNIHQIHCITFTVVAISMLTWVLAMTLCPCLSVTSRRSVEVVGRIELGFRTRA